MLDLTQLENVPEKEKETDLYYWAKLFQAASWKEIAMLAEKNETIKEAETIMRKLNADERIQMQCEAREQIEHDMASAYQHGIDVGMEQGIKILVLDNLEEGISKERICEKLQIRFGLEKDQVEEYIRACQKK